MTKTLLAGALALLVAPQLARAQQGAPKPGPEHQKMAYFAGTWNIAGESKASPMGPAGPYSSKETCEMVEGGLAMVCQASGKNANGPVKSVGILGYNPDKQAYTYAFAETHMPAIIAHGKTMNGTWDWATESKMGGKVMKTKFTVKEISPTSYEFKMEMAEDNGPYTLVSEGKATKTGT